MRRIYKPDARSNDRLTIQRARLSDAAELLRLIRAYYRFDRIRFHKRPAAQGLARLLKDRRMGRVWIFRDGTNAIGYVILSFNFDLEFGGYEGLVTDLFVHKKYRGQGLGQRALETVDDYCRSVGIAMVELQVVEDNPAAREFYRKIGFTMLNRIVMTRTVSSSPGRRHASVLVERK